MEAITESLKIDALRAVRHAYSLAYNRRDGKNSCAVYRPDLNCVIVEGRKPGELDKAGEMTLATVEPYFGSEKDWKSVVQQDFVLMSEDCALAALDMLDEMGIDL